MATETKRGRKSLRRKFLGHAAAGVVAPFLLTRRLVGLAAHPISLPPLLARPTESSILIHSRNGSDEVTATAEVSVGDTGERVGQGSMHAMPGEFPDWSLSGLNPGSRYKYSIRLEGQAGPDSIAARGSFIS